MTSEPRNPLYFLLLIVSLVFVLTALAYAVVPWLEERAVATGNPPPHSEFRELLRERGGYWLLYEVVAMIVVGVASMVLDRMRTLKNLPQEETITASQPNDPSASSR